MRLVENSLGRKIGLLALAAGLLVAAGCAGPLTTAYVVRHAEKASSGNATEIELSPAGHQRAKALADRLRGSRVDAIFVTRTRRTEQTAAPTAAERKLEPIHYGTPQEVVARVRKDLREGGVLIVGHSNTVHQIVAGFGAPVPAAIRNGIPDDEYDNLVILALRPKKVGATLVKY